MATVTNDVQSPRCGIVMPISALDGCEKEHWLDVRNIVSEAIEEAGFEPNIVSDSDEVGIIQKRIIQHLYEDPIIVCDVSGKNPNVMFELGMRLAFDKPTIIIKDDNTTYSFDTSPIEHLEYPRDLRFNKIIEFKEELRRKIVATHDRSARDPGFTTFLKHFGEFKVAKLDHKEVPSQEYILDELKNLGQLVRRIPTGRPRMPVRVTGEVDVCLGRRGEHDIERAVAIALTQPGVEEATPRELGPNHTHVLARLEPSCEVDQSIFIRSVLEGSKIAKNTDPKPN